MYGRYGTSTYLSTLFTDEKRDRKGEKLDGKKNVIVSVCPTMQYYKHLSHDSLPAHHCGIWQTTPCHFEAILIGSHIVVVPPAGETWKHWSRRLSESPEFWGGKSVRCVTEMYKKTMRKKKFHRRVKGQRSEVKDSRQGKTHHRNVNQISFI